MHSAPRARRAAARLLLVGSALQGCGDPAGPGVRSRLEFGNVEDVVGELHAVEGDPTRRDFRCRFYVAPWVVGEHPIRLAGATVEVTAAIGGDGGSRSTTTFSAGQVAGWFGTRELQPGQQTAIWLETWVRVRADAERVGAAGIHRARWAFAHGSDSSVVETRCLAATATVIVTLRDSISRLYVIGAPVQLGDRSVTTNEWGQAIMHEVVLGRHRLVVSTGRHVPLDTTLTLPDPTHGGDFGLLLRRTMPGLHAFRFCPSMAYGGLCNPEIELSDPAGAERLPDSLRITETNEGTSPPHRYEMWSARVETLDATRRRYTFPTTNNIATRIRFEATNDAGARALYECERPEIQLLGFACRESF